MIISKKIIAPHGLLFLSDFRAKHTVPADTAAANVTSTHDCIAFWVIHEVDGEVSVEITDNQFADSRDLMLVFEGRIGLESGILRLSQPDMTPLIDMSVSNVNPLIQIYTNDHDSPDTVMVRAT